MGSFFSGILYPKHRFYFTQENEPPLSAQERLESGDKFSQEVQFFIDFAGNNFKYDIEPYIFTKRAYKKFELKELSYSFEGTNGLLLTDASFLFPAKICSIDEEREFPCWITDSKHSYYWTRGLGLTPISKPFPRVNFGKIFKGKKAGETFTFKMSCTYSFDDEPQKTEEKLFKVRCYKGEYVSPFMGW